MKERIIVTVDTGEQSTVFDGKNGWDDLLEYYIAKLDSVEYQTSLSVKIKNYEPRGDVEGFPIHILERMILRQVEQENKPDLRVFEDHKNSDRKHGGFCWDETEEGFNVWSLVISSGKFEVIADGGQGVDGKKVETRKEEVYKVKESDLTGEIKDFPLELVQLMVQRQFEQTGKCDVKVFSKKLESGKHSRGFDWDESPEGYDEWHSLIRGDGGMDIMKNVIDLVKTNASKNTLPRVVYVSEDKDDVRSYTKRVAIRILEGHVTTWLNAESIEESNSQDNIEHWPYFMEVEEYESKYGIKKITKKEIAEKFGIDPERIEIV